MTGSPDFILLEGLHQSSYYPSVASKPTTTLEVEPDMVNFQDLPPRLVKRVLNLEFVDISELVPGSWKLTEEILSCCQHTRAPTEVQSQISFCGLNATQQW